MILIILVIDIKFPDTSHQKNQQKNLKWVDPIGKIWPITTTENNITEAPLT